MGDTLCAHSFVTIEVILSVCSPSVFIDHDRRLRALHHKGFLCGTCSVQIGIIFIDSVYLYFYLIYLIDALCVYDFTRILYNSVKRTIPRITKQYKRIYRRWFIVGLYSPIGSALEYEASVLRSIHSSGELKCALRGPTTCSDPVGIMDW